MGRRVRGGTRSGRESERRERESKRVRGMLGERGRGAVGQWEGE